MSNTKATGKPQAYIADPRAKIVIKPGLGAPKTDTPKYDSPGKNMTGPNKSQKVDQ
jgi:hypothetical protein